VWEGSRGSQFWWQFCLFFCEKTGLGRLVPQREMSGQPDGRLVRSINQSRPGLVLINFDARPLNNVTPLLGIRFQELRKFTSGGTLDSVGVALKFLDQNWRGK
jgi:hypothetical protein